MKVILMSLVLGAALVSNGCDDGWGDEYDCAKDDDCGIGKKCVFEKTNDETGYCVYEDEAGQ